jgi:hypothetical protein
MLAKDGSVAHAELARLGVEDSRADKVGGHQVGRELHAAELQPQRLGNHAHQQRFGNSWHTLDEDVPVRQ